MTRAWTERRIVWLAVGAVLGVVASIYWPGQPAAQAAYSAAGGSKFDMTICSTIEGAADAVFILDKATGRLIGAMPNRQGGQIAATFIRNLAADFKVADGAEYLMISAQVNPTQSGTIPPGSGGVWVAEQKSGLCILYLFPTANGPNELVPFSQFPWRKTTR
jgi:hypothetical protein